METRTREFQLRLRCVVEQEINEQFSLPTKGLRLAVDKVEVIGRPPKRIRVWSKLDFLGVGSPFCYCWQFLGRDWPFGSDFHFCSEWATEKRKGDIEDGIQRKLQLRQSFKIEFAPIVPFKHDGVQFDSFDQQTPLPADGNINARDALGRTPLMRAVLRGYEHRVKQLVDAGADISIPDAHGHTVVD